MRRGSWWRQPSQGNANINLYCRSWPKARYAHTGLFIIWIGARRPIPRRASLMRPAVISQYGFRHVGRFLVMCPTGSGLHSANHSVPRPALGPPGGRRLGRWGLSEAIIRAALGSPSGLAIVPPGRKSGCGPDFDMILNGKSSKSALRPAEGRKADFEVFPIEIRVKSGPEAPFPARGHYCIT